MSRLLNRTFIFVSFAISLCSASAEVTSTCRDGEPGQDECAPAVPSSLMQKAIKKNRVRPDSASEAVRADEKHEVECPMCGREDDNASCMTLCGPACSEGLGTKCTECNKENDCMDCLECAQKQEANHEGNHEDNHEGNHEDKHEDMCPMCGKEDDNASCMALCAPSCSEEGANCTECYEKNDCMDCLECYVAHKHDHEEHDEKPDDFCPMCDKPNASCGMLCGSICGKSGVSGNDCTECMKENSCTDCLECVLQDVNEGYEEMESSRPDNSEKMEDSCPMCHKPGAQLCAPTCGKSGVNSTDCSECCKESGCTDCLDCHVAHKRDHKDMTNEDKIKAIFEWADQQADPKGSGRLTLAKLSKLQQVTQGRDLSEEEYKMFCEMLGADAAAGLDLALIQKAFDQGMVDLESDYPKVAAEIAS